jgi:hypothetical protein
LFAENQILSDGSDLEERLTRFIRDPDDGPFAPATFSANICVAHHDP